MDPESFFNWEAMDEDIDPFESSSFLSGNFDRSAFTEAILHPSMSQINNNSDNMNHHQRDISYDSFDDDKSTIIPFQNSQMHQPPLVKVKQEPGVVNYVTNLFSDYYSVPSPSIPSYVSPQAITPINSSNIQQYNNNNNNNILKNDDKYRISSPYSSQQSYTNNNLQKTQRTNLSHNHENSYQSNFNIDIIINEQPPIEVRTRTPGENRTFSLKAVVQGNFNAAQITAVSVKLLYSNGDTSTLPRQTILGGTRAVPIANDGTVIFDNLCMTEASTKHGEKEFCLEFYYIQTNGKETSSQKTSNPFYAYSHKKVLTRRKNVSLRALSKQYGPVLGGGEYHIVGSPFIKGPALKCVFRTPHGDIEIKYVDGSLERYSETVLFFKLPDYPHPGASSMTEGEIKASVQVTNDGRHYSNELPFVYHPRQV